MCEYCGCQSIPAIAALIDEHDELRGIAREASSAARRGDRRAAAHAAAKLLKVLAPHNEIEERALMPAMAGEFADHVASLEQEHRHLNELLMGIADETADVPDWAQRLEDAVAELFTHILREQDGLFPATLSVLTPAQWDELDEVRAEVTARSAG